jgi:hypothetical protein
MRFLLAASAAALLATSCAHPRVGAYAGEDRTVQSGVPVKFTGPAELPEGTQVLWDFGDGTQAKGTVVEHSFPRAGQFTVTQTILDKDGEKRTATARVSVLRRSVPMAVPPDARAALVAQWPWARVSMQREIAARLGLRDFYESIARNLSEAVGFDVTSPEASAQNGIDPDEGIGIFTVREDPEALVVTVGISDEAKAEAVVRKLLQRDLSAISPALRPFQLADAKLPSGARAVVGTRNNGAEQVAYTFKYGYLYLRTPGATDPLVALGGIDALTPDKGLERDPTYLTTVKRVGTGDFVFYSAPPPPDAPPPSEARTGMLARTLAQVGAMAFALRAQTERLDVRLFTQLRNLTGEKLVQAFSPAKPPPDLAALLPGGAIVYLKISGSPAALWREVGRAAGDRKTELEERLRALSGVDVEKDWLPLFTGNAGVAFYLDAAALLEAVLGEQVATFDRSTLVGAVEIAEGKGDAVRAVLERSTRELAAKLPVEKLSVGGAPVWKLGDGALLISQKGPTFFFALGGPRETAGGRPPESGDLGPLGLALQGGKQRTLSDVLRKEGVRGFDLPQDQLVYVDIARAVKLLQQAADQQGGLVSMGARSIAERLAGLRDALFEARPSQEGIDAELTIRFSKGK